MFLNLNKEEVHLLLDAMTISVDIANDTVTEDLYSEDMTAISIDELAVKRQLTSDRIDTLIKLIRLQEKIKGYAASLD